MWENGKKMKFHCDFTKWTGRYLSKQHRNGELNNQIVHNQWLPLCYVYDKHVYDAEFIDHDDDGENDNDEVYDNDDEMIFQSSTQGQSQRENAFCSISISLWHQRKTNGMHIGRNLECDLVMPPF